MDLNRFQRQKKDRRRLWLMFIAWLTSMAFITLFSVNLHADSLYGDMDSTGVLGG